MAEDWAQTGSGVRTTKGKRPKAGVRPRRPKKTAEDDEPLDGKVETFSRKCNRCGEPLSAEVEIDGELKRVALSRVTITTKQGGSKAFCRFDCAP